MDLLGDRDQPVGRSPVPATVRLGWLKAGDGFATRITLRVGKVVRESAGPFDGVKVTLYGPGLRTETTTLHPGVVVTPLHPVHTEEAR